MKVVAVTVVVVTLVATAVGHDWGWGNCPSAKAFSSLDVDKFLGLWYVIQQTDTTSSCLTMNYTRVSPTQLRAAKSRQLLVLDSLSIEHTNSYTAKLDIPDFDNAGAMRVKWPLNLAGKADYTVLDTDYDTYAVVYECQKVASFLHRKSTAILSRTPTLSQDIISKERQLISSKGIPTNDLDSIDHGVCVRREDAGFNINIDEDTIKKMLKDASDGVRNIASQLVMLLQVAGGASDLASSLATISRNLAVKGSEPEAESIQTID
ncbi:apolipoprotein D-like isoform X1 [Eriocheir sinensis]|uniref:apolipoprotein D-like isoform X1 n=1 Tax=Eriocheir sinensis TaxID=95602 RepID=UPI0021C80B8B|nr:apolipoprotein D-like isoform X1 [Eriocheir sinensis]XP_050735600.1 apolipoprotein D-like isoform X1 [Eriocheir sinensis]XP_050735601.1 apolipoprotein D-like isoform X1 [Eriocheir sinensis]